MKTKSFICPYCNKEANITHTIENPKLYDCWRHFDKYDCLVYFRVWKDDDYSIKIRQNDYELIFDYKNKTTVLYEYIKNKRNITEKIRLFSTNKILDITPANFEYKLKTLLTFQ